MNTFKKELLEVCFERYSGNLANGDLANNKFNADRLLDSPELRERCIRKLGSLAIVEKADFVTAVPDGANWIAAEVAEAYGLAFVELIKIPDTKEIDFHTEDDYHLALSSSRGVIFEDVARTLDSLRKCLRLYPLPGNVIAAAAIFDRGNKDTRDPLPVSYRSLAHQYIPPMLPEDSELWVYANE